MKLVFGELVLIRIDFHQATGAKIRPVAIAILDTGDDDFIAAPLTSVARNTDYDLAITDWRGAGLNVPSYVRVHKLTVLAKADVVKRLGFLTDVDKTSVRRKLADAFLSEA